MIPFTKACIPNCGHKQHITACCSGVRLAVTLSCNDWTSCSHTHVPLSLSSVILYWPKGGGDSLLWGLWISHLRRELAPSTRPVNSASANARPSTMETGHLSTRVVETGLYSLFSLILSVLLSSACDNFVVRCGAQIEISHKLHSLCIMLSVKADVQVGVLQFV